MVVFFAPCFGGVSRLGVPLSCCYVAAFKMAGVGGSFLPVFSRLQQGGTPDEKESPGGKAFSALFSGRY